MLTKILTVSSLAILLSACALPGNASTIGSSVTGSLTFPGDPSNYFDPGYGFVPTGNYLNAAGTTVTVSSSAIEFGFDDGASQISVDFSANGLTVNDFIEATGLANGFQMAFTDTAFSGQSLAAASDSFPFGSYSLVGDVLTLNYAGGNVTAGQSLTADLTVMPAPEPATYGSFLALALVAFGFLVVRRYRAGQSVSSPAFFNSLRSSEKPLSPCVADARLPSESITI